MGLVPGLRSAIGYGDEVAADSMPKTVNTTFALANKSLCTGQAVAAEEAGSTPLGRIICALAAVHQHSLLSPPPCDLRCLAKAPARSHANYCRERERSNTLCGSCIWFPREPPLKKGKLILESQLAQLDAVTGQADELVLHGARARALPLRGLPTPAVSFCRSPAWPPMQKAGAAWLRGTLMDPNGVEASRRFSNCGPGCQDLGAASVT